MTNWVAPHVGAWIEIIILSMTAIVSWPSHPMWVRGLKLAGSAQRYAVALVAPHVGAWIELWIELWIEMMIIKHVGFITPTHPMRVCGLK